MHGHMVRSEVNGRDSTPSGEEEVAVGQQPEPPPDQVRATVDSAAMTNMPRFSKNGTHVLLESPFVTRRPLSREQSARARVFVKLK